MTKVEKAVGAILIVLLVLFSISLTIGIKKFNEAGGFKQLAVEVGKDIKDINREIDKH